MGFRSQLNVVSQLEFKVAYFKASVQHFTHYTTKKVWKDIMNQNRKIENIVLREEE